MDCSQTEEHFLAYLLGSLEREELRALESHLDECKTCGQRFQSDGEALARLASSLSEFEAPARIKRNLFAQINADKRPSFVLSITKRFANFLSFAIKGLVLNAGKSAVALAVVAVVFSAIWYNNHQNEPTTQNSEIIGQPTTASFQNPFASSPVATVSVHNQVRSPHFGNIVSAEARLAEMTQLQRYFMYRMLQMSTPHVTSVKELQGTGPSSRPHGVMFYNSSNEALLLALDLPPLPRDRVYQIWLIKDNVRYSAGTFTVDSTGYGRAVIIPVAPLAEFEAIGITIEPSEGSQLPTGTSILKGDL